MSAQSFTDPAGRSQERRLLLAVDDSDSSRRAVMWVADFFGGSLDVAVTILSILSEPPGDFFPSDGDRLRWLADQKRSLEAAQDDYRKILVAAGIREDRVGTRLSVKKCPSVGDAILEEQDALRCCIVVLGRRGLSHEEEFMFGSTTTRVLHNASRCAVMVIE